MSNLVEFRVGIIRFSGRERIDDFAAHPLEFIHRIAQAFFGIFQVGFMVVVVVIIVGVVAMILVAMFFGAMFFGAMFVRAVVFFTVARLGVVIMIVFVTMVMFFARRVFG
ncbi:MAG: hypothetical protein AAFU85_24730 [Planctomycetota bacterium]